ncbi:hypothetical protein THAOC_35270 [Thalassiosira oceanica]|uniref:MORN repeat-containing protein 5 n=1 Tax=Thalassiosira oceanica TaxID=159749 RepID=K0R225_THAOC|nr:hypothetical protein THAOC_35270 [Thalassiosira oceanica]|eukprot:EJK46085.1 hypothetical protein THAOC_35270 [Thalassiosira oceanica]
MDGHPPQQSSDDTPPPDGLLDEGASSAADASSTARTAARRGRGRPPKGKGREKSTVAPRRSRRRSGSLGEHSAESSSTTGRSGGGGSIRDSAHNPTRGQGVRDGGSFFQIRGSRARGDEEDGPRRRRRKVQLEYPDGSYVGEALGEKRDGRGKVTFANGDREEGIFVDGVLHEGKVTYTDGHKEEGVFLNGWLHGQGKDVSTAAVIYQMSRCNGKFAHHRTSPACRGPGALDNVISISRRTCFLVFMRCNDASRFSNERPSKHLAPKDHRLLAHCFETAVLSSPGPTAAALFELRGGRLGACSGQCTQVGRSSVTFRSVNVFHGEHLRS